MNVESSPSTRSAATDKTSNGASVGGSTDSEWVCSALYLVDLEIAKVCLVQDDDDEEDYRWNSSIETEPEVFYAHSHFIDQTGDCLSFQRGDRVEIHRKHSNEWWLGRGVNDEGALKWIPANVLQKVSKRVSIQSVVHSSFARSRSRSLRHRSIQARVKLSLRKIPRRCPMLQLVHRGKRRTYRMNLSIRIFKT